MKPARRKAAGEAEAADAEAADSAGNTRGAGLDPRHSVTIFILTVCTEVLALVLRFTSAKVYAARVLGLGMLPSLGQMAVYFWQSRHRGMVVTASDVQFLTLELAIVALASVALSARGSLSTASFWIGWLLNLPFIGVLGYLFFFWHPFG